MNESIGNLSKKKSVCVCVCVGGGTSWRLDSENKRTVDLTDVTEEQVSAFDSSSYQPSSKTTADHDGTDTNPDR